MKTDDLISVLAADTLPNPSVLARLGRAMPVAALVSVLGLVGIWGIRPDIAAALGSAAVLKSVVPLGLALLAAALAVALAHPGMRAGFRAALHGVFAVALVAVFSVALARQGLSGLTDALAVPSLAVCLLSVPVLALPFLAASLWALSAGATLRPRLTGTVAGLVAGGAGAAIYAFYCTQDGALFVLPAYSAAILFVAMLGALLGPRILRW